MRDDVCNKIVQMITITKHTNIHRMIPNDIRRNMTFIMFIKSVTIIEKHFVNGAVRNDINTESPN